MRCIRRRTRMRTKKKRMRGRGGRGCGGGHLAYNCSIYYLSYRCDYTILYFVYCFRNFTTSKIQSER